MKRPVRTLASLALLALTLATPAPAEIKAYDLRGMLAEAGGCVFGRIVDKKVQRVVHPRDGELYFTSIFVEGECLMTGADVSVEIKYMGGFVDDEHGAYNSEAPSEDATRVGRRVVAFYGWGRADGRGRLGQPALGDARRALHQLRAAWQDRRPGSRRRLRAGRQLHAAGAARADPARQAPALSQRTARDRSRSRARGAGKNAWPACLGTAQLAACGPAFAAGPPGSELAPALGGRRRYRERARGRSSRRPKR